MKRIVIPCCFHRARKEEQLGFLVRAITNAVWRCSQKNMSLSTLCIAYQKVITLTRFHAKQFFIQTISIHSTACQSASFACKVQIKLNEHFFFLALQSRNSWNLKSIFQVSSISGLSWQKTKFVHSFFGRIFAAPICFWFYPTFSIKRVQDHSKGPVNYLCKFFFRLFWTTELLI